MISFNWLLSTVNPESCHLPCKRTFMPLLVLHQQFVLNRSCWPWAKSTLWITRSGNCWGGGTEGTEVPLSGTSHRKTVSVRIESANKKYHQSRLWASPQSWAPNPGVLDAFALHGFSCLQSDLLELTFKFQASLRMTLRRWPIHSAMLNFLAKRDKFLTLKTAQNVTPMHQGRAQEMKQRTRRQEAGRALWTEHWPDSVSSKHLAKSQLSEINSAQIPWAIPSNCTKLL